MPRAKIHVLAGRYDNDRLDKISAAIQAAFYEHPRRAARGFLSTDL
jgi:hypothetical protein